MGSLLGDDPPRCPFVWTAPSGRVITWPDPATWDLLPAAAWLQHLAATPVPALFGPLGEEADRRALAALPVSSAKELAGRVTEHYVRVWAAPDELGRLAWILGRYPGAVLWELTPRGVDVRGWVAQRRWWDLLVMLDELPAASAVSEAMRQDPDWVDEQVARETEQGGVNTSAAGWRPSVRDYDLQAQQLADLSARLDGVATAVASVAHAVVYQHEKSSPPFKPPRHQTFPAPRTLLDVRRDDVVAAETWQLYDLFQPARRHTRPHTHEGALDGADQEPEDDRL